MTRQIFLILGIICVLGALSFIVIRALDENSRATLAAKESGAAVIPPGVSYYHDNFHEVGIWMSSTGSIAVLPDAQYRFNAEDWLEGGVQ